MNKVSICTVSMNRLFHVRETLPDNIRDNMRFPDIEFILLDYNSSDGLEDWIRSNMAAHIETGTLKYYRTMEPAYFNISHSKNVAAKLSTGDILCMIDADNYTGVDYADWIHSVFSNNGKNALVTPLENLSFGDIGGKIAFHRDLFTAAGGFDESMTGYGMDDVDLVSRLVKTGGHKIFIKDQEYMKFIKHSVTDRLNNYYLINNLEGLYIKVDDAVKTRSVTILYLLKDHSYHELTYTYDEDNRDKKAVTMAGWYAENSGMKGMYERLPDGYLLISGEPMLLKQASAESLVSSVGNDKIVWEKIDENNLLYFDLLVAYSNCLNRLRYLENNKYREAVNPSGWGKATVYLNFNYEQPICL